MSANFKYLGHPDGHNPLARWHEKYEEMDFMQLSKLCTEKLILTEEGDLARQILLFCESKL